MGDEADADRLPGQEGEFLLDLAQVPVLRDAVGLRALADLAVEEGDLGLLPRAGDAAEGGDGNRGEVDQPFLHGGGEGEEDAGGMQPGEAMRSALRMASAWSSGRA